MNKNIFFSSLFYLSSFLAMMSFNSWFSLWVAMEINTLTFLVFLMNQNSASKMEISITYFMVQAISSLFMITFLSCQNIFQNIFSSMPLLMMQIILIMKIGLAPLHNWFIPISFNSKTTVFWLLLTMQKAPYILILYYVLTLMSPLILILIMLNIFISTMSNMKQHLLKMIFIFSGISQMTWILLSVKSTSLWQYFMFIYFILSFFTLFVLESNHKKMFMKNHNTFYIFTLMMSLSGIPPFMNFFPKVTILNYLIQQYIYITLFYLIIMSLMDLFIYTRISIFLILMKKQSMKTMKKKWSPILYMVVMNILLLTMFL